jgi:DNA-binding MarR family transcriptional regulator
MQAGHHEHRVVETARLAEEVELRRQLHRTARKLARYFDEAFRPIGLTSRQFSLLNALSPPEAPAMTQVASLLSIARTTLTATLRPLLRQRLVEDLPRCGDRRCRRMALTAAGRRKLADAVLLWRAAHIEVERRLPEADVDRLRDNLRAISRAN